MLRSGCANSTRGRRSSVEQTSFFFEPVQFHLQPTDVLVERVPVGVLVPPFSRPPIHEQFRQLFQRRLPPLGDLHRVHLELRSQLAQRLFPADRLNRHLRLELWTVLFSRRRHRLSCVHDCAEILAYCLVQILGTTILHCGDPAIIASLNCVTSVVSFGPGLFRKGFACSTRISSASVPSTLMVSSMNSFSGMAQGSSLLFRRSVCTHGGAISRTLTEVALSL